MFIFVCVYIYVYCIYCELEILIQIGKFILIKITEFYSLEFNSWLEQQRKGIPFQKKLKLQERNLFSWIHCNYDDLFFFFGLNSKVTITWIFSSVESKDK